MTNEEAIVVLQKIKPIPHRGDGKSITHTLEIIAIDMAIKALEQQPCEDCISRQEAISAIQDEYYYHAVGIDIVDIVAHLPSVTPKAEQKWIPCIEMLPKDGDTYLVTIEYKDEVIGVDAASYSPVEGYIDKHWDTFNDWKEDEDSCYHVLAWMPLPKPYKAESEE